MHSKAIPHIKGFTDPDRIKENDSHPADETFTSDSDEYSMSDNTSSDGEEINSYSGNVNNDIEVNMQDTTEMSPLMDTENINMHQLSGRAGDNITNYSTSIDLSHKMLNQSNNVDDKDADKVDVTHIPKKDDTDDIDNLLSDLKTGLKTNVSDDEYADCVILDFAGHKEYYTTHQTFLTEKAVYLITTKLHDSYVSGNEDDEG